jgi:hypothetical protein
MTDICNVIAIDSHEDALRLVEQNIGTEMVRRGPCVALPLKDSSVDCVTALDVIEHVEADRLAVREFARVSKARRHHRRNRTGYALAAERVGHGIAPLSKISPTGLLKLFDAALFEIRHWNYINVLAVPAVFAARDLRPLFRGAARGKSNRRLEDKMLPSFLDDTLSFAFKALACQSWIRFPAVVPPLFMQAGYRRIYRESAISEIALHMLCRLTETLLALTPWSVSAD